ncbi:MAG: phosphopantothenoylcysteine decarboxylase domain-containing protein, partial [Bdellovibrionota bacterium]
DYSVSEVRGESGAPLVRAGKLASGGKLTIGLTPNFKIISRLAEYARPHSPKIVGFKLTDSAEQRLREEAIRTVLTHPGVELVVHNDLSEIQAASHPFTLVSRGGERRRALGAVALASAIEEWLS